MRVECKRDGHGCWRIPLTMYVGAVFVQRWKLGATDEGVSHSGWAKWNILDLLLPPMHSLEI